MLLVRTFLAASSIHGTGLFAAENIKKGAKTWELNTDSLDKRLRLDEILRLPAIDQEQLSFYGYEDLIPEPLPGHYIWCGDNARYINHSVTPNTYAIDACDHAAVDIPAGTELTSDYASFGVTDHLRLIDWNEEATRLAHLLAEWGKAGFYQAVGDVAATLGKKAANGHAASV